MFAPKYKMVVMSLKIYSAEKIETQKPSSLNSYKTALSYNKNFRGKKASEYTCSSLMSLRSQVHFSLVLLRRLALPQNSSSCVCKDAVAILDYLICT